MPTCCRMLRSPLVVAASLNATCVDDIDSLNFAPNLRQDRVSRWTRETDRGFSGIQHCSGICDSSTHLTTARARARRGCL
jgi:hypothetical protein